MNINIENWRKWRLTLKYLEPEQMGQFSTFVSEISHQQQFNGLYQEGRQIKGRDTEDIFNQIYKNKSKTDGFILIVEDSCNRKKPIICAETGVVIKNVYFNGQPSKIAYINSLNVRSSHQKLGLAKKMVRQAEKIIKEEYQNIDILSCEIPHGVVHIQHLFSDLGFTQVDNPKGVFSRWRKNLLATKLTRDRTKGYELEKIQNYTQFQQFVSVGNAKFRGNFFPTDYEKEMIDNPLSIGLYSVKPSDPKQTDYAIMHIMKSSEDYQIKTKSVLYMNYDTVKNNPILRIMVEHFFAICFFLFFASMNILLFLLNQYAADILTDFSDHYQFVYGYLSLFTLSAFQQSFGTLQTLMIVLIYFGNRYFKKKTQNYCLQAKPVANVSLIYYSGQQERRRLLTLGLLQYAGQIASENGCGILQLAVPQNQFEAQVLANYNKFQIYEPKSQPAKKYAVKFLNTETQENAMEESLSRNEWSTVFVDPRDI